MPISYKYKTIFIHIPKCAGTTVGKILDTKSVEEFCFRNCFRTSLYIPPKAFTEEEISILIGRTSYHYTNLELRKLIPPYYFREYSLFSIIRNPYSRLVSEYHYLLAEITAPTGEGLFVPTDFKSLVDNLSKPRVDRIIKFEGHLEPQVSFLVNKDNVIDNSIQIYRHENIEPCFDYLKKLTGVTTIPNARKSRFNKPYQEYYTKELQDIVYQFYKEDFDTFGYSYDL